MKFKARLKAPRLDLAKYEEMLREHLVEALAEALFLWLQVTAIEEVPVWSGASRATFLKLAANIRYDIPIFPEVPSRVPLGISHSDAEFAPNDSEKGLVTFTYSTDLDHLVYNEQFNANNYGFHLRKPGPYQFRDKGQQVFKRYAAGAGLPNPWQALSVKTLRVG